MIQPEGHKNIIKTLEKIVRSKKIPHSFIFSGIEGIGKKLTALYFAKMLNCESSSNTPCNECSHCKKIDKYIHPDILLLSTEKKQITLDMIRDIISFSVTNPFEGKYKIVIIDDAHKLNPFASNALLKTIEEPLTSTIFILITHSINRLPSTIQSRCVKINFSPLDDKMMIRILTNMGYEKEKIEDVIPYCSGSIMQATKLLDEAIFTDISSIKEFIEHIETKSFFEISCFCEDISKKNREELLFSIMIKKYFLQIINDPTNPFSGLNKYQKTINFYKNMRYNISKTFLLEAMFLTLQK
jgi:DNA polymerase-3 subunit delta'